MTPIIENLLIIQDDDLRIMKFERELADIPHRKAAMDSLLDERRQAGFLIFRFALSPARQSEAIKNKPGLRLSAPVKEPFS